MSPRIWALPEGHLSRPNSSLRRQASSCRWLCLGQEGRWSPRGLWQRVVATWVPGEAGSLSSYGAQTADSFNGRTLRTNGRFCQAVSSPWDQESPILTPCYLPGGGIEAVEEVGR